LSPECLQYWYKNFLSSYKSDICNEKWHPQKIEIKNSETGDETEKPIYIFKEENLGEKMSIDDKAIGHDGFTIFSNHDTGKIALMVESTKAEEVSLSIKKFGDKLTCVKNISMDMSATYALVCSTLMPHATQVIDKFHVMKYVYEAVGNVRNKIRKELADTLTKGKTKTEEDKQKLAAIERLRRVNHAITQSPEKWNEEMKETVSQVFEKHEDLKIAYQISQNFKRWYNYNNFTKTNLEIKNNLYKWYEQAIKVDEFKSVIKMIRKHEDEILNFFKHGMTSAKAERLNGKIERFVSSNYGIKNKDFFLYRVAGYFS
jgi:transposase